MTGQRPKGAVPSRMLLASLLLTMGCSGTTEIQLTAERTSISAGGIDSVEIVARAMLDGSAVGNGTTIEFQTTAGSFDEAAVVETHSASTDATGRATARLYSGPSADTATVTASFYDETTGLSATSSISIEFTAPSGSKNPVAGTFRLTCDAVNIGALRAPLPDIRVTCRLAAQTRDGAAIPASAFKPIFLTEAGTVAPYDDPYSGERVFIYTPQGGASAPRDVPPDAALNEPSYADINGKQRNPRDGLATIVAVVQGEEAFTDLNGNGEYDSGEPFTDSAEPFVDADDDDQCDPDEKFIDVDGNGRWDKANGRWDESTRISALYKILWTGALDSSPDTGRIERLSTTIPDGGSLELKAYLLDANMNPIAAFEPNQDYLEWTITSGGDAISDDSTTPPLRNERGFDFDTSASTERKRWTIVPNSFSPPPHSFTVKDGYPGDTEAATTFSVSAAVYSTPGPGEDGYYLTQVNEQLDDQVEGTCD